jgi:CheY-like chemotaxis protein
VHFKHSRAVLVIDDDEVVLGAVVKILESRGGYKCFAIRDPIEGLRRAKENDLDLIILDITMPGMSGLTLAREIRDNDQPTPILFLTGGTDDATLAQAQHISSSQVMSKPVQAETLITTVRSAINQSWTVNKISQLKDSVDSMAAGQRKLFATTDTIQASLIRIEGAIVTKETVEDHFIQVAMAVGQDSHELAGEIPVAVHAAREGLARAIVKRVDEIAFTDFLTRILKSPVFWALFIAGVTGFMAYVRAATSVDLNLKRALEDYNTIKHEQVGIKKDLGEIKGMLKQAIPPSPAASPTP